MCEAPTNDVRVRVIPSPRFAPPGRNSAPLLAALLAGALVACSNDGTTNVTSGATTSSDTIETSTAHSESSHLAPSSATANPATSAAVPPSPEVPPIDSGDGPPVTSASGEAVSNSQEPTSTESSTSAPTSSPGTDTDDTPRVHFVGRFAHDGAVATFAWSGSGIIAAFSGTEVAVQFEDGGSNEFTVLIDGASQPTLSMDPGANKYPLAQGLEDGRHVVELYRRTEASQGSTTFQGFDFGPNGTLLAPPPVKARRIEIIGDSITCGYGNEGADTSCTFSPETENHYLTYGAIAARTLEAELSTIAWSGKGIVYNYDTDTNNPMPTLYNRTLPDDAASRWDFSTKPNAVVINLGTNDYSTDGDPSTEQFRDAYLGLLQQVRDGAPNAFILCTVGNMLGGEDLDAARAGIGAAVDSFKASGDTNIAAWDMNVANDDPGCDWHPNIQSHALMAEALVAELESHLNW